jgi:hypothetical protein
VRDTLDADGGDRRADERRQQHPPQRVAERVAKATVEGLDWSSTVPVWRPLASETSSRLTARAGAATQWARGAVCAPLRPARTA